MYVWAGTRSRKLVDIIDAKPSHSYFHCINLCGVRPAGYWAHENFKYSSSLIVRARLTICTFHLERNGNISTIVGRQCHIFFIHLINKMSYNFFFVHYSLEMLKKKNNHHSLADGSHRTNRNRSEHFQFNWFEYKKKINTRILLTQYHRANPICRKIEHCTINLWAKWLYILLNAALLFVRPFCTHTHT